MERVKINSLVDGRMVEVGAERLRVKVCVTGKDGTGCGTDLSVAQAEAYKAALTEAIKYARG